MKEGDRAGAGVVGQILNQPIILGCARFELAILAGGVDRDEMPSSGVEAVVMRHIVPIIEITRGHTVLVFVVANGWIGDVAELPKILRRSPVPVVKLGRGALIVDIAQVQEHVRIPRCDHIGDLRPFPTRAIARRRHDERLAGRRRRSGVRREGVGIHRRLGDAIVEGQVDGCALGGPAIAHIRFDRQLVCPIDELLGGDRESVRSPEVGQQVFVVEIEQQFCDVGRGSGQRDGRIDRDQAAHNGPVRRVVDTQLDAVGRVVGGTADGRGSRLTWQQESSKEDYGNNEQAFFRHRSGSLHYQTLSHAAHSSRD